MSEGVVVAQGTPAQIIASDEDYVRQFVHGQMDGWCRSSIRGRLSAGSAAEAVGG